MDDAPPAGFPRPRAEDWASVVKTLPKESRQLRELLRPEESNLDKLLNSTPVQLAEARQDAQPLCI